MACSVPSVCARPSLQVCSDDSSCKVSAALEETMKTVLPVVFVLALALTPRPAAGQILGTYCGGGFVDWCFEMTAFGISETSPGYYESSVTGIFSGDSEFDALGGGSFSWLYYLTPPSTTSSNSTRTAFAPGSATTATGWHSADPGISLDSYRDFSVIWFYEDELGDDEGRCGVQNASPDCDFTAATVPEPSTYLLMLTGVLGLGFVAYRRREDALA